MLFALRLRFAPPPCEQHPELPGGSGCQLYIKAPTLISPGPVFGDLPDELLCIYRDLLDHGVEQRRLLFLREHAKPGAYDWIERNGTHANLQQRVVLPEQAEVMRLSFVIIDEEVVVISVPGGGALDGPAYSRELVFRDLLVLRDSSVANAFVEIHRQLWGNASVIADPRRLCAPTALLAEVRSRLKNQE